MYVYLYAWRWTAIITGTCSIIDTSTNQLWCSTAVHLVTLKCHDKTVWNVTTKPHEMSRQNRMKCHDKTAWNVTTKSYEMSRQNRMKCHDKTVWNVTTKPHEMSRQNRMKCHDKTVWNPWIKHFYLEKSPKFTPILKSTKVFCLITGRILSLLAGNAVFTMSMLYFDRLPST